MEEGSDREKKGMREDRDVVFITGCSDGGMGAALAMEFAKRGRRVVASSRSLASMQGLSSIENVQAVMLDVTDFDAAKATVERVVAEYGHIDVLVNNAAVPCMAPVAEVSLSTLEATYKTNILGPVSLIQAVVPHMAARRKGRIVNIGSIGSRAYSPWAGCYVSSKAALEALTDALRLELKPFSVQVILILPGVISTNMGNNGVALFDSVLEKLNLYKPFEPNMRKFVTMGDNMKCTPVNKFAQKVVAQILAKHPPAHYAYGALTSAFFFLFYTPLWIRDFIFAKSSGLNKEVTVSGNKID